MSLQFSAWAARHRVGGVRLIVGFQPLKVYCGNSETRAKKLKDLPPGHKHKRLFIRSDLTQLQRDQDFKKRQVTRSRQQGNAQATNRKRHLAEEPSSSHGHRAGNHGLKVAYPPPLHPPGLGKRNSPYATAAQFPRAEYMCQTNCVTTSSQGWCCLRKIVTKRLFKQVYIYIYIYT